VTRCSTGIAFLTIVPLLESAFEQHSEPTNFSPPSMTRPGMAVSSGGGGVVAGSSSCLPTHNTCRSSPMVVDRQPSGRPTYNICRATDMVVSRHIGCWATISSACQRPRVTPALSGGCVAPPYTRTPSGLMRMHADHVQANTRPIGAWKLLRIHTVMWGWKFKCRYRPKQCSQAMCSCIRQPMFPWWSAES